jgi:hypothetical protein
MPILVTQARGELSEGTNRSQASTAVRMVSMVVEERPNLVEAIILLQKLWTLNHCLGLPH